MKIKIQQHYAWYFFSLLLQSSVPDKAVYKKLAVIGPQRAKKQTPVYIFLLNRQSSIFYLPYLLQTAPQNLLCCEIFNISLKD